MFVELFQNKSGTLFSGHPKKSMSHNPNVYSIDLKKHYFECGLGNLWYTPMAYPWHTFGVFMAYLSRIHGAPLVYPWRTPGIPLKLGTVMINSGRD